jgi:hypothetical protein
MADQSTTTSFPVMGDKWYTTGVKNISGARSSYTIQETKKGFAKGEPTEKKANRGHNVIHGAQGKPAIKIAKIAYPNCPENSQTERNVKTMPSAAGFDPGHYGATGPSK